MALPLGLGPLDQLALCLMLLYGAPSEAWAGFHTLRYDLVALSQAGGTQFLALGFFDGVLFLRYDGETQKAQPWGLRHKEQIGDIITWEQETEHLQEKEHQLRRTLADVVVQKGHEEGLNTLQATLGCELQGNLSAGGFWRLGYRGQDFLTFDPASFTWTATLPSARQSKQFWEVHGPSMNQVKNFLYETCPKQLQRHLAALRDILVDTGSPSVIVTHSKRSMGRVTLKCSAFNVNRWGATLTWLCDGDPMHQGIFGPGTILPSGDGTYQTWVTTHVLPGEEHRFICHLRQQGKNTTDPVTSGYLPRRNSGAAARASSQAAVMLCALMVLVTDS
ncbi:MHC class I-like protein MILL2 isoform X2 [Cavia porcellus]|uniref:MHC class I-like protein MILL2 isoform X2 n=1 Tax=Cavia porcellus TaxID=10141 RepID=UPI000661AAEE|nr:zinc-alpha-2-glycoprotein-like [Cavia porcellus]